MTVLFRKNVVVIGIDFFRLGEILEISKEKEWSLSIPSREYSEEEKIKKTLRKFGTIIISEERYQSLSQDTRNYLQNLSNSRHIFIIADTNQPEKIGGKITKCGTKHL